MTGASSTKLTYSINQTIHSAFTTSLHALWREQGRKPRLGESLRNDVMEHY